MQRENFSTHDYVRDCSTRGYAEHFGSKVLQQIAAKDDDLVRLRAAIAFRFAERVLFEQACPEASDDLYDVIRQLGHQAEGR